MAVRYVHHHAEARASFIYRYLIRAPPILKFIFHRGHTVAPVRNSHEIERHSRSEPSTRVGVYAVYESKPFDLVSIAINSHGD